jgi:MYXO-CTERM domain-containing protein
MQAFRSVPLLVASFLLIAGICGCELDDELLASHGLAAWADENMADDDTPSYPGEIDLAYADIQIDCYVDVLEGDPEGEGTWEFTIFFEGWATDMWIEMTDLGADYCEGWDDNTGDPCDTDGEERPGWYMVPDDFGWDAGSGFWDQWLLDLPYHTDVWPPEADASWIPCEVDADLLVNFCGCDEATENCFCTQHDEFEYAGDDDSAGDGLLDACECRADGGSGTTGIAALALLGLVLLHRRR